MRRMVPARCSAAVLLLGGGMMFAQLPAPTAAPASAPAATPAAAAAMPTAAAAMPTAAAPTVVKPAVQPAARPARVVYSGGKIEVDADNSSLRQIFQKIAEATGMKITGSVADERVFGKYGPGAPAEILKSLLGGTGVNLLLKETASGVPEELILTPQDGSAAPPPAPAAQQASAASVPEPDVSLPAYGPGGPQDVVRDINGVPVSQGAIPAVAAPPPVQTPEQLQQRIQQAQQQQQQETQQRQQAGPH